MISSSSPLFSVDALPASAYPVDQIESVSRSLVLQAFDLIATTDSWSKGKLFQPKAAPADGGPIQTRSKKSGFQGRAGKCSWHMRESFHPVQDTSLTYDDFRSGLLVNHAENEREYIPSLTSTTAVQVLKPELATVILNTYKLPIVTADRDFLELLITVDLPAHRALIADEAYPPALGIHPSPPSTAADAGGLRSFLVVQVPVLHPDAPEQKDYVRGNYASVEAVYEASGPTGPETHWKMATQSDAKGSIPLFFSESSLPGKVVEDVPDFLHWIKSRKEK